MPAQCVNLWFLVTDLQGGGYVISDKRHLILMRPISVCGTNIVCPLNSSNYQDFCLHFTQKYSSGKISHIAQHINNSLGSLAGEQSPIFISSQLGGL